jgi:hypothetical protein
MRLKHFLSAFLAASCACLADADPIRNSYQCQFAPKELAASCRKTVEENRPFYFKAAESDEDCRTISDNTVYQKCLDELHNGGKWSIQTDSLHAQPHPLAQERVPGELERIAKATERTALMSSIQLGLMAVGITAAIVLSILK